MRWIRRWLRRRMKPIDEYDAMEWKKKLSFVYAFFAWNTMGFVAYHMYNTKYDWAAYYGLKLDEEINQSPAVYWAEVLDRKKARIIRIKGFEVVDDYEYVAPEIKE